MDENSTETYVKLCHLIGNSAHKCLNLEFYPLKRLFSTNFRFDPFFYLLNLDAEIKDTPNNWTTLVQTYFELHYMETVLFQKTTNNIHQSTVYTYSEEHKKFSPNHK